jgi:hypothetical protein
MKKSETWDHITRPSLGYGVAPIVLRHRGAGKDLLTHEWQEYVNRTVDLDYIAVEDAVTRIREAGEGVIDPCLSVDQVDEPYSDYKSIRSYVAGWTPLTDMTRVQEVLNWDADEKAKREEYLRAIAAQQLDNIKTNFPELLP